MEISMRSSTGNPHEKLMSLLIQAQNRIDIEVNAILKLHEPQIKTDHWYILRLLNRNKGMSMKEIHIETTINDSTLTKAMDKLVAQSLAYRKPSESDRRKVLVFISKKGQILARKVNKQVQSRQLEFIPQVSPNKLEDITNYLGHIAK